MLSFISSRHSDVVSMLIVGASKSARAAIAPHLGAYPTTLLEQLVENRCSVRPLRAREAEFSRWSRLRLAHIVLGTDVRFAPTAEGRPVLTRYECFGAYRFRRGNDT